MSSTLNEIKAVSDGGGKSALFTPNVGHSQPASQPDNAPEQEHCHTGTASFGVLFWRVGVKKFFYKVNQSNTHSTISVLKHRAQTAAEYPPFFRGQIF